MSSATTSRGYMRRTRVGTLLALLFALAGQIVRGAETPRQMSGSPLKEQKDPALGQSEESVEIQTFLDRLLQSIADAEFGMITAPGEHIYRIKSHNDPTSFELLPGMQLELEYSLATADRLIDMGVAAYGRSDFDKAEDYYRRAFTIQKDLAPAGFDMAVTLSNLGDINCQRGDLGQAAEYYLLALDILEASAPSSHQLAATLGKLGTLAAGRGNLTSVKEYYQLVLTIGFSDSPHIGQRGIAIVLHYLGVLANALGDLTQAKRHYQHALAILEQSEPDGLQIAATLANLGALSEELGDFAHSSEFSQRALGIFEDQTFQGLEVAACLYCLGRVAQNRGDLSLAESYYQRAHDLYEDLAPRSLQMVGILDALGDLAQDRVDLGRAEQHHNRALTLSEELASISLEEGYVLQSLGDIALARGDLDRARYQYSQARDIFRELAPNGLEIGEVLSGLGTVELKRGDLTRAEGHLRGALSILEKMAPRSLRTATCLGSLGILEKTRGNDDLAELHFQEALVIQKAKAPRSLQTATVLYNLGRIALEEGRLTEAENYLTTTLAISEEVAPNSIAEANALHALGVLFRKSDRTHLAVGVLNRSIEALEAQIGKLGGSRSVQGGFRAGHGRIYRDTIEVLLELNQPESAFHVLERSRARSFLATLAERDLVFAKDIPESIERDLMFLGALHDHIRQEMAELSPETDQERFDELVNNLRRLRERRHEIEVELRRRSPELADLKYPNPLSLPEVQGILDPGTVMLSYSVGKEQIDLFVIDSTKGLTVKSLPVAEGDLRREVEQFLSFIPRARPGDRFGDVDLERLRELGRRLYDELVQPVAGRIEENDRVLIVPDGPLHMLPFGALLRETEGAEASSGRQWQYLVEWKPLRTVLSATLFAELKKARRARQGNTESPVLLSAFGDPQYSPSLPQQDPKAIPDVRSIAERGTYDRAALPYTRHEVEEIADLFPADSVRTYLGTEATEEHVKAVGKETRILHIAAHGYLDQRFPLESFVALTIPDERTADRDNGLLQVWEIFERVRLDADLVVLSACQTGLGEELGGEGLIGLTRAFQYAGARAVIATLWSVQDRSTAELMVSFYRHLQAGKPKDEALRAAQIELIRGQIPAAAEGGQPIDASAPFYWAAFQLHGD